ncbi:MAG: FHA domain-containing protein [Acidimicrobiales bacterium]
MSVRCPDGHDSTETDYCSVCGLAIAGSGAAPTPVVASPAPAAAPPAAAPGGAFAGGATCANCGEPHGPDDVFCENCGFDFASETLPEPEQAVTSIAGGAAPAGGPVGEVLGTVTISTDAAHHARMDSEGVLSFPDPARATVVLEIRTPVTTIGRAKASRGIHPDIDLASDVLEDPAASSRHAVIERKPDGTWWITDLGSTNGTYLGDTDTQLAPDTPTAWTPGTPVLVGAWTKLELAVP